MCLDLPDFRLRNTRVVHQEAEVGVSLETEAPRGTEGNPCVMYSLILNMSILTELDTETFLCTYQWRNLLQDPHLHLLINLPGTRNYFHSCIGFKIVLRFGNAFKCSL